MRKKSTRRKKSFDKKVSEVYSSRQISATDIVQEYCLGKVLKLEDGHYTQPLTKREVQNVRISAHHTTLMYDDGMSMPVFILDVIEPKVYCGPEMSKPIINTEIFGDVAVAVSYCPHCFSEINNLLLQCPYCKTRLNWF